MMKASYTAAANLLVALAERPLKYIRCSYSAELVKLNHWASAVNEMGTGRRPIICQVLALCSPRPDSWLVTARVCRKWPCIN